MKNENTDTLESQAASYVKSFGKYFDGSDPNIYQVSRSDLIMHFAFFAKHYAESFAREALKAEQSRERQFICKKCGLREELGIKIDPQF